MRLTESDYFKPSALKIELIALKNDLKKVIRPEIQVSPKEYVIISEICKKMDLAITPSRFFFEKNSWKFDYRPDKSIDTERRFYVYISKQQRIAEFVRKSLEEHNSTDSISEVGKLFGYPQCCIERHCPPFRPEENDYDGGFSDFLFAYQRTAGRPSWYLNNSNNIKHFLISHLPCSYDCKASISYAKKLFLFIRKTNPGFADRIRQNLQNTILILNNKSPHSVVSFFGFRRTNDDVFEYEKSSYYGEKYPFQRGNKIIIYNDRLTVKKDDLTLFTYMKKSENDAFFIDFSQKH